MTAPLDGLRVVDLSRGFGGALATLHLADYGAEVIRIEPPEGDPLRGHPAFPLWGRGKKSVVLDARTPRGQESIRELARGADVFVETLRPGVAERLDLGYERLEAENPRLVYASLSGFGERGPYAQVKGYEGLVMAKLGAFGHASALTARPGPSFTAAPYASFSAAHALLHAILAALYERESSGLGQRVASSLVQGIVAHDPWDFFLRLAAEKFPDAFRTAPNISPRGVPNQSFAFRLLVCLTRDGRWLQFSQTSQHLFREFMQALELDWMFDDPEWSSAPEFDSESKRERFWGRMLVAARRKTLAEWNEIFERYPNVWGELYRSAREVLDHPQMRHNRQVVEIDDPRVGRTRQLGALVQMPHTPAAIGEPAAELGRHTDEVLGELRESPAAPPPARPAARPSTRPPLEGVSVLELGFFYAAPYGPTILAEYGARVLKVEPLQGDPTRHLVPFPEAGGAKVTQGKESIAVDTTRPEGREIVQKLGRRVDMVMLSMRAGVAERLGVDYAALAKDNPRLIYLHAAGYGSDGPCARKPAFAPTIGAGAGVGLTQAGAGFPAGPELDLERIKQASLRLGTAAQAPGNADGCAALAVGTALLLGLLARERLGVAQPMLSSMVCTSAYLISADAIAYAGQPPPSEPDPQLYGMSALYRLYEAREGWLFLAAPEAGEWPALAAALAGWAPLADDARFATPEARRANDAELAQVLGKVFRGRPAADWERELLAADVGCVELAEGPISRAVLEDAVTREAGLLCEVEHPSFGRHRRIGPHAEFSRTRPNPRPGCLAGQHTESILRELGYAAAEIDALEADGIIVRSG